MVETKKKILDLLENSDDLMTAPQLASRLGINVNVVDRQLSVLKSSGAIQELTLEELMRMDK